MKNVISVIALVVNKTGVQLISNTGSVVGINDNTLYDIPALTMYLAERLDGKTVVEIDLNEYSVLHQIIGSDVQDIFIEDNALVVKLQDTRSISILKTALDSLRPQIARAAAEQSNSVTNFLRLLAEVQDQREHTAQDLLDFIKASELPLTEDGHILAYKRLTTLPDKEGMFDVHSNSVNQFVGDAVFMAVSAVDPDRNKSCSHGLHVANLGYLKGFSGDSVVLVRVDPRDFIAVPHGEVTKARVCKYHILAAIPDSAVKDILNSQASESKELEALLAYHITTPPAPAAYLVRALPGRGSERFPATPDLGKTSKVKQAKARSGKSLTKDKATGGSKEAFRQITKRKDLPPQVKAVFVFLATNREKDILREFRVSTATVAKWKELYDYESWLKAYQEFDSHRPVKPVKEQCRKLYDAWLNIKKGHPAKEKALDKLYMFKAKTKKGWVAMGLSNVEAKAIPPKPKG